MRLDLSTVLVNEEGKPRKNVAQKVDVNGIPQFTPQGAPVIESKGDIALSDVLFTAVNAQYKGEEGLSPADLLARGKLARKVKGTGEKNFTADEIVTLSSLVGKRYAVDPLLNLQVAELLDPDKFKVDESEK